MQKMDLLLSKTPKESVTNDVLPMVFRALEAPSQQIQVKIEITDFLLTHMHGYSIGKAMSYNWDFLICIKTLCNNGLF